MTPRIMLLVSTISPAGTGGDMRDAQFVHALKKVGDVTIFVTAKMSDSSRRAAAARYGVEVLGGDCATPGKLMSAARYVLSRDLPLRLARVDARKCRTSLRTMSDVHLVVCRQAAAFHISAGVFECPVLTDLDDLQSEVAAQRLRIGPAQARSGFRALQHRLRYVARDAFLRAEIRRWKRMERRAVDESAATFVCSAADRDVLGATASTFVVHNGFDPVVARADHEPVGDPPTVTFWGLMSYAPNADGAVWFATNVWPLVRDKLPGVRGVLVGMGADNLPAVQDAGLDVTGFVDDLSPFLRDTDAAIVPLRMGGGTRIKIIEAWANGIPVVSTTIGAHGLSRAPDDRLVLADTSSDFAHSVVKVLTDLTLRRQLIRSGLAAAAELTWERSMTTVADVARTLLRTQTTDPTAPIVQDED